MCKEYEDPIDKLKNSCINKFNKGKLQTFSYKEDNISISFFITDDNRIEFKISEDSGVSKTISILASNIELIDILVCEFNNWIVNYKLNRYSLNFKLDEYLHKQIPHRIVYVIKSKEIGLPLVNMCLAMREYLKEL